MARCYLWKPQPGFFPFPSHLFCDALLVLSDMENKSPLPIKEALFFSKSRLLSPINQWRIVYGAQEIGFRARENKGLVFYTLSITAPLPLERFTSFLYGCSFAACFPALVQSITFYSGMEHFIQPGIAFRYLSLPWCWGGLGTLWSDLGSRKGQNPLGKKSLFYPWLEFYPSPAILPPEHGPLII